MVAAPHIVTTRRSTEVTMRPALTGKPCDATHPFPVPPNGAWSDSMEYGLKRRRPDRGPFPTADVDPSPIWRVMAAWLWETSCVHDHVREVAADTALTTRLLAAAM